MTSLRMAVLAAVLLAWMPAPARAAADEKKALELINSMGCKGCHQLKGEGGTLGPALDRVGERLSREEIYRQLTDARAKNPSSMMPSFSHLPKKDLNLLADYLFSLK